MVKPKTGILQIFTGPHGARLAWVLPLLSFLTFISSWAAVYPARWVERWYARGLFPKLSQLAGLIADSVSISWLDVLLPLGTILLVIVVRGRRWRLLLNVAAGLYLVFFWTWGLNYHRERLASKLQLDSVRMKPEAMREFGKTAVEAINRLYAEKEKRGYDEMHVREETVRRVRRVVAVIDNLDWDAAQRIKISRIGSVWMRAAGIEGVFNPIGHEPTIKNSLLDVERPFVMAHELAHVRGYPEEGDANVIAAFATLMSDDPAFQYSGWLNLWPYLATRDLGPLLHKGPRDDLQRISDRAQSEQIEWINDFQRALLDLFLKANNVEQGVRSYSRVVLLVAGAQESWERFR